MARRAKVKVVTGFCPIPDHPRSLEEYGALAEQLKSILGVRPSQAFHHKIPELWLTQFIEKLEPQKPPLTWAKADNPAKNSLEYHCVQHQKVEWLALASTMDQEADTFVWIDMGIMHVPDMTGDYITTFLDKIVKNDFAIPGCWAKDDPRIEACGAAGNEWPNWRFCGGVWIVPRADIANLTKAFKACTRMFIRTMKKVSFEVNMLSLVEQCNIPNLRWYLADHNPTMFTNYEPK